MYEQGRGVPQDDAEAVKWYQKAAEQNDPLAQTNLGAMYLTGRGVPRDEWRASGLFSVAGHNGCEQAQINLELLRKFHFLLDVRNAVLAVLIVAGVVFGSLILCRIARSLIPAGQDQRESGATKGRGLSTVRMAASMLLVATGIVAGAIGFQQLSKPEQYISDTNGMNLILIGPILFCAGAFCPFHRTFYGAFAGFALAFALTILFIGGM
jgi:hypothetical protein